ncbi:hypothetical protein T440DRAFT_195944 [Plenodomus tracheiphilus IPT5]|uniref:Uncharacterized protein n=1 Tax=Plenodomus tracheiphilus IPT5 TaxID=1408161 RepID=A0A6A7AX58_9PLEO|nr:hypothetical protein T440DRAFT_195944 [Plenodomus tracheiphilus IPT5]
MASRNGMGIVCSGNKESQYRNADSTSLGLSGSWVMVGVVGVVGVVGGVSLDFLVVLRSGTKRWDMGADGSVGKVAIVTVVEDSGGGAEYVCRGLGNGRRAGAVRELARVVEGQGGDSMVDLRAVISQ